MGRKVAVKGKCAKSGRRTGFYNKCLVPSEGSVEAQIRSRGSKNRKGLSNDEKMQLLQAHTERTAEKLQADYPMFEHLAKLICVHKDDQNLSCGDARNLIRLVFYMYCARSQLPCKAGGGVEGIVCQVVQRILTGENRYVRGGKNMTAENKRVKRVFGYAFDDHPTFAHLETKLLELNQSIYGSTTDEECTRSSIFQPYFASIIVKQELPELPLVKEEPMDRSRQSSFDTLSSFATRSDATTVPFIKPEESTMRMDHVECDNDYFLGDESPDLCNMSIDEDEFDQMAAKVGADVFFPGEMSFIVSSPMLFCVHCDRMDDLFDGFCWTCLLR
jgi:hypothetical protein